MTPADEIRVEMWRLDQFAEMGFSGLEIATLLTWDVDLEDARKLMAKGCPHDLAMRILRPDEASSHEALAALAIAV